MRDDLLDIILVAQAEAREAEAGRQEVERRLRVLRRREAEAEEHLAEARRTREAAEEKLADAEAKLAMAEQVYQQRFQDAENVIEVV